MRIITILFFTIFSLMVSPALAQFDANSFTNPDLGIDIQPSSPQPGEEVTASLNDYAGGTYGSTIAWFLNGKEIPDAANQREITFIAGKIGTTQTVEIVLTKPNGGKVELRSVIHPAYLDVIIEPQTRVPDFYLGRSLPSIGSQVNATALISGIDHKNSDLIYTWRLDQQVIEGGAVRGKNQISFQMPMSASAVLSIQAANLRGDIIANRSILIHSVEPEIYFYELSSLLGVSQKPFASNIPFIGNSISIKAEPYNLDSRTYNNPDILEWKIDRVVSSNSGSNPYEVTLKRMRDSGISQLEFHVRDTEQVLQGARTNIQINY